MLKTMIQSIKPSYNYVFKDKVNFTFSMIPIAFGIAVYSLIGKWMYGTLLTQGREMIQQRLSSGGFGDFVYYIVMAILTVVLFFVINWTFVLIVSIIASPFNDLISARIEKLEKGEKADGISESFGRMFKRLFKTIFNELKKVSVIGALSILAVLISFFPLLAPISIILSAILLSVQFIDYSWSRNDIPFSDCMRDIRSNIIPFTVMGTIFIFLISIPIANLFVPPIATSYFTVYWLKRKSE